MSANAKQCGTKSAANEQDDFLGLAKSYLSKAFPNQQRVGCPPDRESRRWLSVPRMQKALASYANSQYWVDIEDFSVYRMGSRRRKRR
jgi:hypothetical protein